ncbi:hypothetical protein H696_01125 [Fonticula alba]|uniref:Uncharacterized protein n=1 Tax=Fonticula alba TaxID=691883 RepID=A0A058ZE15_FONAL|nr:hypothetical protein H696_01125 [Fonticula alba]KCV71702.1 hypothetical protein H696_01125 [Fonticula alba]|eukprot:XP_009493280.1 hypothetical protein H696_01125 [Fonticula alba]
MHPNATTAGNPPPPRMMPGDRAGEYDPPQHWDPHRSGQQTNPADWWQSTAGRAAARSRGRPWCRRPPEWPPSRPAPPGQPAAVTPDAAPGPAEIAPPSACPTLEPAHDRPLAAGPAPRTVADSADANDSIPGAGAGWFARRPPDWPPGPSVAAPGSTGAAPCEHACPAGRPSRQPGCATGPSLPRPWWWPSRRRWSIRAFDLPASAPARRGPAVHAASRHGDAGVGPNPPGAARCAGEVAPSRPGRHRAHAPPPDGLRPHRAPTAGHPPAGGQTVAALGFGPPDGPAAAGPHREPPAAGTIPRRSCLAKVAPPAGRPPGPGPCVRGPPVFRAKVAPAV